ncbi:MAG: hypothetical protein KJ900_03320 [Proteobacteria bacterium]|jgi:hypothetical protein|nr:hypothetical protein [Desulfocapsa sp.]MBU3945752.1 hypothetical protein [Pseudomonadota bacterium]MCG2745398.1 hypothetical protein [Desulfobacteraceae bacterium]MBU3982866.1 hypothetical protein [Pseudomonadota bacterium]MBU4030044.1 hypothetical protein [Pseudomonadota bacterium]
MPIRQLNDREVVILFVEYMATNFNEGLEIETFPDEQHPGDIDAIAGKYAIEHTSIDFIHKQSRDSTWFLQAFNTLEQEFTEVLHFGLFLTLPYNSIQKGADWQGLRTALHNWIADESINLADGSHIISNIPGVPFEFHARKTHSGKTGLSLLRFAPILDDFPSRLRNHLDRKIKKLAPYKCKDKSTILLIESDCIAFMNEGIMWDSLSDAYPEGLPTGIDNVWFVHTSMPKDILFFNMNGAFKR